MLIKVGELRKLIAEAYNKDKHYSDKNVLKTQKFYHASPKRFRHGDILTGGHTGGWGTSGSDFSYKCPHKNVCLTTSPVPHGTIQGIIPGWMGQKDNLNDKRDWFVYEVEPINDEPTYVAGNSEYQVRAARVIKNLGLAKNFLPKGQKPSSVEDYKKMYNLMNRKGSAEAYPPAVERDRREKHKKRQERNLKSEY